LPSLPTDMLSRAEIANLAKIKVKMTKVKMTNETHITILFKFFKVFGSPLLSNGLGVGERHCLTP